MISIRSGVGHSSPHAHAVRATETLRPLTMLQSCGQASTSGRHAPSPGILESQHLIPSRCGPLLGCRYRPTLISNPSHLNRRAVCCGSSQSNRFRLEFDPKRHSTTMDTRFAQAYQEAMEDEEEQQTMMQSGYASVAPASVEFWHQNLPGQVKLRNRHAQRARMTPIAAAAGESGALPLLQQPFPGEEYFLVDLERTYSKEWPSVEIRDGKVIVRRGFLEPLDDPNAPYHFFYSGVERFTYSLPERTVQAVATVVLAAAHIATVYFLFNWQPQLALAAVASWLTRSLSLTRLAGLAVLAAFGKVWIFWMLLGGGWIDGVLHRYAPAVRRFAWMALGALVVWNMFTTIVAPPVPIWPFMYGSGGALDYPYPIPTM